MKRATSFKKVVVCHTNDFKPSINEKIQRWVEANGGTFSKELTADVTHLVTSKKAWKRYHGIVQQARRMRTVHIVKYDWLEDSLMRRPSRALPEEKYLFEPRTHKRTNVARKEILGSRKDVGLRKEPRIVVPRDKRIETTGVEFEKAKYEFEQDMATMGFHPYADRTGFVYIVTLVRYHILKRYFEKYKLKVGGTSFQSLDMLHDLSHTQTLQTPFSLPFVFHHPVISYEVMPRLKSASRTHIAEPWMQCVQLYESDREPHTYACYTQYTRPGITKQVQVLAPPGSTWAFAWAMFEKFFKTKVCCAWSRRPTTNSEIDVGCDVKEEEEEEEERRFQYVAPRPGEPEGLRLSDDDNDEDGKKGLGLQVEGTTEDTTTTTTTAAAADQQPLVRTLSLADDDGSSEKLP